MDKSVANRTRSKASNTTSQIQNNIEIQPNLQYKTNNGNLDLNTSKISKSSKRSRFSGNRAEKKNDNTNSNSESKDESGSPVKQTNLNKRCLKLQKKTEQELAKLDQMFQQISESPAKEQKDITELENAKLPEIQHSKDDFICGICLNYIQNAVSTNCGHSFCEYCLSEYLIYFSNCIYCNKNLRKHKFRFSILLDQMIEAFIQENHPDEYEYYLNRKNQNKSYKQSHQIQKFEVGSLIDVRDPNYIWCQGRINKIIFKGQGKPKCIVVHYQDNYDCYDEEIIENSQRFASWGSYTNRKDIPHYSKQENLFLRKFPQIEIDANQSTSFQPKYQDQSLSQNQQTNQPNVKKYYIAQVQYCNED